MYKTVVGDYKSVSDAQAMVNYMLSRGFPKNSISVIANRNAIDVFRDAGVMVAMDFDYIDDVPDETLWQRIKSFFGAEKEHDIDVARYTDSIRSGHVLVLVDESLVPARLAGAWKEKDVGQAEMRHAAQSCKTAATPTDTASIRLEEERMHVDKHPIQTGEVKVHKRVVEETETVDVPVRHEEVVIERVNMKERPDDHPRFEDETITIPVMEEKVEVTKTPVITGEVKIHKQDYEETEAVSATLRKEKLDVDKSGKAVLTGEKITR